MQSDLKRFIDFCHDLLRNAFPLDDLYTILDIREKHVFFTIYLAVHR